MKNGQKTAQNQNLFWRCVKIPFLPEKQQKTSENISFSEVFAVDSIIIHETWRKERDSNPRYVAVYLISSQGRYDHFDIFP